MMSLYLSNLSYFSNFHTRFGNILNFRCDCSVREDDSFSMAGSSRIAFWTLVSCSSWTVSWFPLELSELSFSLAQLFVIDCVGLRYEHVAEIQLHTGWQDCPAELRIFCHWFSRAPTLGLFLVFILAYSFVPRIRWTRKIAFSSLSFEVTPFKWENCATISVHFGFQQLFVVNLVYFGF